MTTKIKPWILAVLLLLILLAGCAPTEAYTMQTMGYYGVQRFVDEEAGVVCWVTLNRYGLSCLPLSETALEASE